LLGWNHNLLSWRSSDMHDEPRLGSHVRPDPPALDSWARYPVVLSSGLSRLALSVERAG